MKRGATVAILAVAVLLTACGGNASIRADAARVNAMGQSLKVMTRNISDDEEVSTCTVTHESSGWLTAMWTDNESFTTTCEKDPYDTDEYEGNVNPDNPWAS